jgi:hypothetical protein
MVVSSNVWKPRRRMLLAAGAATWIGCAWAQGSSRADASQAQPPGHDHDHDHTPSPVVDVVTCLKGLDACRRFADLLAVSGMEEQLLKLPQLTVFAPVDAAVGEVRRSAADARRLVRQHVANAYWDVSTDDPGRALRNLDGGALQADGGSVNGAPFLVQGIRVTNGVVHLITALIPS